MEPSKKYRNDIIIGALAIIFAGVYFAVTYSFRLYKVENTVDAAFFPRVVSGIVAFLGLLVMIRGIINYKRIPKAERIEETSKENKDKWSLVRILLIIADLLAAAFLFKKLGFLLTAPWMMFFMFLIINEKGKRKYWLYILLSVVVPIVVFFVFYYVFKTLLPVGILKKFLSMYFL